jgi:hypothetical protein
MTTITTIQQAVVEILEVLSPEKQQELLNFAEFLQTQNTVKRPRKSLKGMWADLNIDITEEELRLSAIVCDNPRLWIHGILS